MSKAELMVDAGEARDVEHARRIIRARCLWEPLHMPGVPLYMQRGTSFLRGRAHPSDHP